MDTDLLKTFLEVSHTRHFGKAAENLYLTQSAVSARIRQLEELIGSQLFVRTRHNIRLTTAGERLRPHADSILTAINHAWQDVALHQHQQRTIAIGATPNVWEILLQERVTSLLTNDDRLLLRAESLSPEILPRRLLERTLDLCVMFDPPKVDELQSVVLQSVDMVLVSTHYQSKKWLPLTPESRWINIDWGTRFALELARTLPGLPLPVLQTNSLRIALDALLQCSALGEEKCNCAYLPATMAEPWLESGQLYLVQAAPVIQRDIYAACLQDSEHKTTLEDLIVQLRAFA